MYLIFVSIKMSILVKSMKCYGRPQVKCPQLTTEYDKTYRQLNELNLLAPYLKTLQDDLKTL